MKTAPVKIKLKEGAVPYSVTTARQASVLLFPKVMEELDRMVKCGVIEEITEPTEWCAPMVPVPRKNGQVRICVGLNPLNEAVEREKYILATLDDILPKLAGASVLTAGSHYRISANPFTQTVSNLQLLSHRSEDISSTAVHSESPALKGHTGTAAFMDDIIVYGETPKVHDQRLKRVLQTLKDAWLKFNEEKCKLRRTQIQFFGHIVDKHGVRPDTEKVEAIRNVQPPQNITELKWSWAWYTIWDATCPNQIKL